MTPSSANGSIIVQKQMFYFQCMISWYFKFHIEPPVTVTELLWFYSTFWNGECQKERLSRERMKKTHRAVCFFRIFRKHFERYTLLKNFYIKSYTRVFSKFHAGAFGVLRPVLRYR